ncbi:MAG: hypothetical protein M5U09_28295 [Gammaproteobacteria bacterium]|nr:hypothetical protein [Gammaproteobacteria bacterium]
MKEGQEFDIFIYLIRHKSGDLSDVAKVEFFLGSYWGNEIIAGSRSGATLAIRTSAYAPFLCTCVVSFNDGGSCVLERYIDFEMGRALNNAGISG